MAASTRDKVLVVRMPDARPHPAPVRPTRLPATPAARTHLPMATTTQDHAVAVDLLTGFIVIAAAICIGAVIEYCAAARHCSHHHHEED